MRIRRVGGRVGRRLLLWLRWDGPATAGTVPRWVEVIIGPRRRRASGRGRSLARIALPLLSRRVLIQNRASSVADVTARPCAQLCARSFPAVACAAPVVAVGGC